MLVRTSLKATVRLALEQSDYNTRKARDYLVEWAAENEWLRDELLWAGAGQVLGTFHANERHIKGVHRPHKRGIPADVLSPAETKKLEERRQRKYERRLFWDRYALFGQLALKDATEPDLKDSIDKRRTQAAGNIACANFEEALRTRMVRTERRNAKTVEEYFHINKVIELAKAHGIIRS